MSWLATNDCLAMEVAARDRADALASTAAADGTTEGADDAGDAEGGSTQERLTPGWWRRPTRPTTRLRPRWVPVWMA